MLMGLKRRYVKVLGCPLHGGSQPGQVMMVTEQVTYTLSLVEVSREDSQSLFKAQLGCGSEFGWHYFRILGMKSQVPM